MELNLPRAPLLIARTLALALAACAPARPTALTLPSTPLLASRGAAIDVRALAADAPLTVLVFFSRECHCLEQHDGRLRALYAAYHPRGVAFAMVDAEIHATAESDAEEAARRGYPFPILVDLGGKLAAALDAQYATYSVIVSADGAVLYRGGIDSDKTHLRTTATPYLRSALDDLLAGHSPRVAEAKTLGCALQTW